jgi:hypothetical protein
MEAKLSENPRIVKKAFGVNLAFKARIKTPCVEHTRLEIYLSDTKLMHREAL